MFGVWCNQKQTGRHRKPHILKELFRMKTVSDKVMNLLVSLFMIVMCGVVAAFTASATALGIVLLAVDMFLLGVMTVLNTEKAEVTHAK